MQKQNKHLVTGANSMHMIGWAITYLFIALNLTAVMLQRISLKTSTFLSHIYMCNAYKMQK